MIACMIRYIWDRATDGFVHAWEELKIVAVIFLLVIAAGGIGTGIVKGLAWLFKVDSDQILLVLGILALLAIIVGKVYEVVRDAKRHCEREGK